ncbi:hypothetical protein RvY_12571 [Ramazzottius varieornatus]|uniref:G-protein coupled receptors family 1 profile domain-containing protein n=1 Tax=Ramazzottius varieornatus TaxID=947166 RepID=A0A1D1VLX9_RAMVA|nr:hypothetical protein RvY_12571 [Ramazzottius varieornatus]
MNNSSTSLISGCNWKNENPYKEVNVDSVNTPSLYVELIIYPILLFICTLGSIITISVLATQRSKTTTNVYLIALAVSDLCVLWLNLPLYIGEADPGVFEDEIYFNNWSRFHGLEQWWQETAVQLSDWTLIVFSVERLLAISMPLNYRNRLTVRRAIYLELVVLLLAALSTLENPVMWYYVLANDDGVSSKQKIATPALLRWETLQREAETGMTIAKWALLASINGVLIVVLVHQQGQQSAAVKSSRRQGMRNSTAILLGCHVVYFLTQMPNVVYKCLVIASLPPYCSYNFTFAAQVRSRPFVTVALLTNYSVSFFLYCLVSRKFRFELRRLLDGVLVTCRRGARRASHVLLLSNTTCASRASADLSSTVACHVRGRALSAPSVFNEQIHREPHNKDGHILRRQSELPSGQGQAWKLPATYGKSGGQSTSTMESHV